MTIPALLIFWASVSGVSSGAAIYVKSLLIQIPFFADGKNAAWLSIVLQTIAGVVGFATAQAAGVNLFSAFSATATAPLIASSLVFGVACCLGGQGIYVILSVLAGHTVTPSAQDVEAPQTYVPFLVVPRATVQPVIVASSVAKVA